MHDLIIKGGTVVDGTGAEPYTADVAVSDGKIVDVGRINETAHRTIDADGLTVTPGFVDVHTHYDAQATWDPHLTPSGWHGVTTAVCGNCGVGFAPARPQEREFLIGLMEGVEDIPGAALSAGIRWDWETFPEYLDALDRTPKAVDLATQVPHGSVRTYVMGERGANNEAATDEDIEAMARIVREGIEAGALGFSTSRTILHKAITGEPVPGTFAGEDELFGIGRALGEAGRGVFEIAGAGAAGEDIIAPKQELEWMRRLSAEIGRPVTFAMLQVDAAPDLWRELFDLSEQAAQDGARIYPQVAGRPFGVLIGHQTDFNLFSEKPTYKKLADLPFEERIAKLQDPDVKSRILAEEIEIEEPLMAYVYSAFDKVFKLGDPPNYEPEASESVAAEAERRGVDPASLLYDMMLEKNGRELLFFPLLNYSQGSCDPIYEMMHHPRALLGLGDGGAHCGIICDASIPTFMLTHWVRDRTRGPRVPVEFAVKRMTADTADLYGLGDRGRIAPGLKADFNVIDMDALALELPVMAFDLPAGGAAAAAKVTRLPQNHRRRRSRHGRRPRDRRTAGPFGTRPALSTYTGELEPPTREPMQQFEIYVEEEILKDLRDRLARTRWPDPAPVGGWDHGTDGAYLRGLCEYWRDGYDWRAWEKQLNRFDHFKTDVDGYGLHFIHARSRHENATPLLMAHGWPGSVFEFHKVIEPLTDPTAFGGQAADAFHVVCPSIPGYGWSDPPREPGCNVRKVAALYAGLMDKLGYPRFMTQGGDWGAFITSYLGFDFPHRVAGLHLNFALGFPDPENPNAFDGLSEDEMADFGEQTKFLDTECAYQQIQGTKPQTLGYALMDSPAGLCGWIVEKFHGWTDSGDNPEDAVSRDEILTNAMIYWITGSITSSTRIYLENMRADMFTTFPGRVEVPTAYARFPREFLPPADEMGRGPLQRDTSELLPARRTFRGVGATRSARRRRPGFCQGVAPLVRHRIRSDIRWAP